MSWFSRIANVFRPGRVDRALDEEATFHIESRVEDLVAAGMTREAAEAMARRLYGNRLRLRDSSRDVKLLPWLDDVTRDVRHGFRSLRRNPVFTAVVLLTLALGIGANTAIFSVVNAVLLRPLGYPKPEQLMQLTSRYPELPILAVSASEYAEFRQMNRSFAAVGAYMAALTGFTSSGEVNLTAGDHPLRVRSIAVDAHLLAALGFQPAQGRFFSEEETSRWTGTLPPPLAILSHELWRRAFGGQPLVGRTVDVEGRPHEVVGIMPPGADLMDHGTEIWLPLWIHPLAAAQRGSHLLSVVARLRDGVSPEAAEAELNTLLDNWRDRVGAEGHVPVKEPSLVADHTLQLQPLQDAIVGNAGRSIWVLQAAVGFLLLIVCANLANLVMAHADSRRREFVVRTALGASRGRLIRQRITEGVLVSGAGGLLGLWLARTGIQTLVRVYPASVPRTSEIAIDSRVLLVALGLSIATALLFALAPIGDRKAGNLVAGLRESGDRSATGARRHLIRRVLVTAEVALAVMLVIGAGLLLRTVQNLWSVDSGFDRSRLVTFSMTLPMATSEPDTRAQAYQRLLDRLRATPGVQSAAVMSGLPPNRSPEVIVTRVENYTGADGRPVDAIDYYQLVMGDYFATMAIPIVAGRGFEPADVASEGKVVVVNEALARKLWKGENPIGRRLRPNLGSTLGAGDNAWHTVIGVARDVKQQGVDQHAGTELYVFLDQHGVASATMNVVLRTALSARALAGTLERLVREVDPGVPVVRLREMDQVFAESIRRPRLLSQLLAAFAALALLLAAIGTYGVLSYMVGERRREIGIRVALGAARSGVLALIMRQGLQLTITGLIVGIVGALGVNRLIASLLFGVEPTDATTLFAVVVTIMLVATFACWLPAWRASRLDPNVVLRVE
jgi:putative ABC transport system permease protein